VAEICTGLAGKFRQVFATLHNMVGAKEIHTYLEQQQTEKLETKVTGVKRIRITKVYACCLSEAYATKSFLQPATSQPRLHGMSCLWIVGQWVEPQYGLFMGLHKFHTETGCEHL
jgi:hypothetical protein